MHLLLNQIINITAI